MCNEGKLEQQGPAFEIGPVPPARVRPNEANTALNVAFKAFYQLSPSNDRSNDFDIDFCDSYSPALIFYVSMAYYD